MNREWLRWTSAVPYATVCVLGLIALYQILVPPIVGVANNGDFERIMGRFGLYYLPLEYEDKFFGYINAKFTLGPSNDWSGYFSSEMLFIQVALWFNALLSNDGLFDIRFLSMVHLLAYLVGVGLVLWAAKRAAIYQQIVLAVLIVLVFGDVGYIAFFNSFYSEPASLISLAFVVGFALKGDTRFNALAFLVASTSLVVAKPQNSLLGLPLAIFALLSPRLEDTRRIRLLVATLVLLTAIGHFRFGNPTYMQEANVYNAVFHEMLKSSDPQLDQDLLSLGLPTEFRQFVGTSAYSSGAPIKDAAFRSIFFGRVGFPQLLGFYATHPDRFLDLLQRAAESAFTLRSSHLGNFEKASTLPPRSQSDVFSLWSSFKRDFFPGSIWLLLGFFIANVGSIVIKLGPNRTDFDRSVAGVHALLVAMATMQFFIAVIGEGEIELAKHLFLFHALLDACLIICALDFARCVARLVKPFDKLRWIIRY